MTQVPGTGAVARQMGDAVEATRRALATLRTGRAQPEMLDRIRVSAYGTTMPLPQLAQVGVQPPRALVVSPHDPQLVGAIERAIRDSDLGVSPSSDGARVRIELPAPTAERRTELARVARAEAEKGRVAVRNARRDAINALRRAAADGTITQAKLNGRSRDIQQLTDEHVARIDELLATTLAILAQ